MPERGDRPARPGRRRQGRDGQDRLSRLGLGVPGRHRDGAGRSPLPLRARLSLGRGRAGRPTFDPEIAAATAAAARPARGRARAARRGARAARSPISPSAIARPVVEVYLDSLSADEHENALIAPPWSSVPWHVLALMEAAVERDIAAFSRSRGDAARHPVARSGARPGAARAAARPDRGVRQERLSAGRARGPRQCGGRDGALAGARQVRAGERPSAGDQRPLPARAATRRRPTSSTSSASSPIRWARHLRSLRLSGRARSSPGSSPIGNGILIAADVEIAVKEQRDRASPRQPLTREPDARDLSDPARRPAMSSSAATARSRPPAAPSWEADGRFAAPLPAGLSAGSYTAFRGYLRRRQQHRSVDRQHRPSRTEMSDASGSSRTWRLSA